MHDVQNAKRLLFLTMRLQK